MPASKKVVHVRLTYTADLDFELGSVPEGMVPELFEALAEGGIGSWSEFDIIDSTKLVKVEVS